MVAERFAVIPCDDDERARGRALFEDRRDERRERSVGRRHFAEIRRLAVLRRERLGRRVRKVRVVQVYPGEPGIRA